MSHLLEILGGAITVDTADLMWHWLNQNWPSDRDCGLGPSGHSGLDEILQLMGNMKLDAATEKLRLHLFEDPGCIWGRLAAAAICLHNSRLNEAVEELNSVYMRRPSNTMALYALGHCYERLGKESEAVEFYQDCLKFKNYLQLPAQRLAAIYLKNGQLQKALQQYELLNEQHPGDISTLVTLGHLYIARSEHARAIQAFHAAILLHPNSLVTDDRVDQLVQDGQLYEALDRLEKLLEREPDRPDLIARQGDVLSMSGALTEAVSQYQQALRLCPDFLEPTIKLGTCYLQMDARHLAAQQFNRAVDINDQIVDAYLGLATAHRLSGHTAEALATLSLAASIQPNSSFLFAETATLLFSVARADEAATAPYHGSSDLIKPVVQAHQQQVQLEPQNPDLLYRLGVLLMNVGKLNDATECFRRALQISPDHTRAKSKLTICLYDTGHREQALDQLSAEENPDRDTLVLHYKTALLYCDRVKFASSLINLDRHLKDNLVRTDSSVHIALVLQNLGVLDRVAAMWENLSAMASEV
jgi:tetratricopeptide (TPR) repeat protein